MWAKCTFLSDTFLGGWHFVTILTANSSNDIFKAHLICWWHVLPVKQVLKSSLSRKLTWQTVDIALVSPKSHGSGWSCFNLYRNFKKGLWFYMCRGAFFTVLCNTLITEKRNCFCRKGWRFEDFSPFVFVPSSKGPVAVFRWSYLCQKN